MNLSTRTAVGPGPEARWSPLLRSLASLWRKTAGRAVIATLGLAIISLGSAPAALAQARPGGFGLDQVTARAKALVDAPYVAPVSNLPEVFGKMQFADYMKLQPKRERFVWAETDMPFQLAFYHQGMHFNTPVKISEIVNGAPQEIPYDPDRFHFGDLHFDREQTSKLGWAGFRITHPVNKPGKHDEIMSVLGASYFRVIGKDQIYGLSGRGLAIDTGLPIPEEFPAFREFWIRRPAKEDKAITFYALMDSPRATGAYEFTLTPGSDSVLDVRSRVFLRAGVEPGKLGIAPLTSMFLHGPNQPSMHHNFRPAIHDSNGLAIHTAKGEWIWRPLNNPLGKVAITNYALDNPKGFGLLQRGRDFSRYEDIKDRYDLRPSAWIEPTNDWGKGEVRLVEIPTADETNDNIVSLWAPSALPAPGEQMNFDYRVHWTMDEPEIMKNGPGYVWQTMRSSGEFYQSNLIRAYDGTLAFLIDFKGASLASLSPEALPVPRVSANDNIEIIGTELQPNPAIKGWRLTYRVKVKDSTAVSDLNASLELDGRPLTETWNFQLPALPAAMSQKERDRYLNRFKAIE